MGDLALDTAVESLGEGRYRAHVQRDWEIWGPEGGYVAAIALRAAGAEAKLHRPASFACHYLATAAFDAVELQVVPLRRGRNAESLRVTMTQGTRAILDATVWTIAKTEGLEHSVLTPPSVPEPLSLPTLEERIKDEEARPRFAFWSNFEARPVDWVTWPPKEALPPQWRQWIKFLPTSTFEDPWIDAARTLVLVDVVSWPSASRHHAWRWGERPPEWMAPSLDLYVAFHDPQPHEPWLLLDGQAPLAQEGLIGWTGRLWSTSRRLVASGGGQLLCRRLPPQ